MEILPLGNRHVLAYRRDGIDGDHGTVAVLANMGDRVEWIGDWGLVALLGPAPWEDLVTGGTVAFGDEGLQLEPYQFLCLSGEMG